MSGRRWLYAWGLGSVAAGGASLLVPLYVIELGAGATALGGLSAVAAAAGALGAFVLGRFADATGRWRRLGGLALGGIAVALVTVPLVEGIALVVAANGLLWLSFSAATPVFTMLAVAEAPPAERTRHIASLNQVQGYGWTLGLALGAVWTAGAGRLGVAPLSSQRLFFAFCAAVAVAGVLAAVRWLPADGGAGVETPRRKPVPNRQMVVGSTFPFLPGQFYGKIRNVQPRRFVDRFTPPLAVYFLAIVIFFAGFGIFFAPLPVFLAAAGYSSEHIFLLYVVSGLGSAVSFAGAGELSRRYDVHTLQAGALGVRGLALPVVIVFGAGDAAAVDVLMAGLFAVLGVAWAVIAVTATEVISDRAPDAIRGEALGVYTAISSLAGGLGSLVGGVLADAAGFPVAFGVAGIVVVASALLVLRPVAVADVSQNVTSSTSDD